MDRDEIEGHYPDAKKFGIKNSSKKLSKEDLDHLPEPDDNERR